MSKKAKIYLAIGIVVAMIQILWIVPEMKSTMLVIWNVLWKILLVILFFGIPAIAAVVVYSWFSDSAWFVKLGIGVASSILTAGINTGLAHLVFMKVDPSWIVDGSVSEIGRATLVIFMAIYIMVWIFCD